MKMCLLSYVRYNLLVIFLILGFIETSRSSLPDGFICYQQGTCGCVGNRGEILDLTPLSELNAPLFAATNESLYIYHPCTDVSLNSHKNNDCKISFGLCYFAPTVASTEPLDYHKVLTNLTTGNFSKLAVNKESVIRVNQKRQIEFVYKHTVNASDTITTFIYLNCDESVEKYKLLIIKTSPNEHKLTLTSKYSCIKAEHHLSGGAVFIIIVVVFFAIYFLGGILVLKFIRGATGVEMIPNHAFWCKVPQMAKDGFAYVVSCGKTTPDSYETI